jgi:hypothetical protein
LGSLAASILMSAPLSCGARLFSDAVLALSIALYFRRQPLAVVVFGEHLFSVSSLLLFTALLLSLLFSRLTMLSAVWYVSAVVVSQFGEFPRVVV